MTQKAASEQKSAAKKTKWLKLALVGTALLLIPRRSSNKSAQVEKSQNDNEAD